MNIDLSHIPESSHQLVKENIQKIQGSCCLAIALARIGWCYEMSYEAAFAYYNNGFEGVMEATKWADDEEHDYSGEMVDDIEQLIKLGDVPKSIDSR